MSSTPTAFRVGTLIVVDAVMREQQRPAHVLTGCVQRILSDIGADVDRRLDLRRVPRRPEFFLPHPAPW